MKRFEKLSVHVVAVLLLAACTTGPSTDAPLAKADELEMDYIYSFGYDKCGEHVLGQRLREALFAKLESCPFTAETKQKLYKDAALITNKALSGYLDFLFAHPATRFVPPEDAQCNNPDKRQAVKLLQTKLSEYDAGKIKLADVIVHAVGPTAGEPTTCVELSRSGYPDPSSVHEGTSTRDLYSPSPK
jgi:hypothetical protein